MSDVDAETTAPDEMEVPSFEKDEFLGPDDSVPIPMKASDLPSDDDLGLVGGVVGAAMDDDEEEEEEKPKKRGRPKKGKRKMSRKTVAQQVRSREMSYQEWCEFIDQKIGWDTPGTEARLSRIQPEWWKGLKVGGLLDTRESGKFTEREILERFGGGTYEVYCIGLREPGLPPLQYKKRFSIAGAPRLPEDMAPGDLGAMKPGGHTMATTEAEKTAVSHLGSITDRLLSGGGSDGASAKVYQDAYDRTRAADQDRIRAREEMAERAVKEADVRYERAREEADRARREMEEARAEAQSRINEAATHSNSIIATLLPTFSDNAARQVQQAMTSFQAREERIEADHAKEIAAMQRSQEMALERAEQQRAAELARVEAMFHGQLGMVQSELATVRAQLEAERNQANGLREEIRKLHMEQISHYQKEQDPIAAISKYQAVAEFAKEVLPQAGGGDGAGGLSDDAPDYMKLIAHATQTLGPAISQALQLKQQQADPAAYAAMQQQQQMEMARQQQMALAAQTQQQQQQEMPPPQPTQAMVPAPPPGPPQNVQVSAGELKKALEVLSTVKVSGTQAADAASAAMTHGDHAVLRAISERPPDKVIEEIDRHGLLPGPLSSDEGRSYLMEVLQHLKQMTHQPGSAVGEG
jgi:hypothetical protein